MVPIQMFFDPDNPNPDVIDPDVVDPIDGVNPDVFDPDDSNADGSNLDVSDLARSNPNAWIEDLLGDPRRQTHLSAPVLWTA